VALIQLRGPIADITLECPDGHSAIDRCIGLARTAAVVPEGAPLCTVLGRTIDRFDDPGATPFVAPLSENLTCSGFEDTLGQVGYTRGGLARAILDTPSGTLAVRAITRNLWTGRRVPRSGSASR
jgi:hypothetical protein